MALEDIFRALEEQADKDVEAVLAEAREHADAILDEAQHEAGVMRDTRVAEAEKVSGARSAQALNTVRLEARKRMAAVKERAVSDAFAAARVALSEIRSRPDYPALFTALLEEAVRDAPAGWEVLVDEADASLAAEVLGQMGLSGVVRSEVSTTGGVVLSVDGGRVLRRNTLEDRLDKFEGAAQAEVAGILFA